ncbi:hypothetical protein NRB20_60360 [Nocardia sp. RB20]|uniref:Uncharacterized protein n=2 Tax=Nocardia macrotermitis TaxID=2585198 RepID=A0A7K0DC80_9NOCA|nr:hypothetical protein [Nocardia macrotermitis]
MTTDSSDPNFTNSLAASMSGDPKMTVDLYRKNQAAQASENTAKDADKLLTDGGHDADYISAGVLESFLTMKHQTILDGVSTMQPGTMQTFAQAWTKIADAVMFNSMGLNSKVQKSLSDGSWQGATSDALQNATRRFVNELTDMHNVTQSVSSRITSAAYGAEVVKGAVPPIPAAPSPAIPTGSDNPAAVIGHVTSASEAEQAAQHAMVNYYVPSYQPAGQQVPTYVPPKDPNGTPGPSTPQSKPAVTSSGPDTNTNPTDKKNPSDSTDKSDSTNQHKTDPAAAKPTDSTAQQQNTTPSSSNQASTTPAGVDTAGKSPTGLDSSSATPGSSTYGNSTAGGGSGISYTGGSGGNSSARPESGRSVPGTPGTGSTTTNAATATRSAAATSASSMPGMGAPAGKGTGKEDRDRKGNPELLVHERNKIDLVGEPVPAVPPVFGEKRPAPPDRDKERPRGDKDDRRA